ncbi:MAG TPA: tetratricopeptide repeat protein [Gammaproteobacteria bacterium]|nr:tetratricopeptide repeat protein [Gammaproteobacteria bacterium]
MKRAIELLALSLVAAAATSVHADTAAANDPSRLFATGSEAFARGDFDAARAAFEAARRAGMDTPAVLYDLGVTEYKLGRYVEAEDYFRELAQRFPAMRELSEYNLGLALTRQDRVTEARDAFAKASLSTDEKVAALANAMLARIDPDPRTEESASLTGGARRDPDRLRLLDVGVGVDGNVALVDEASLPLGATTDSPLAQAFGMLRGRPWVDVPLSLDVSGYMVRYVNAGEFDQSSIRLGAAYNWELPGWRIEAGPYYSRTTLSGDGFERRVGASFAVRRGLGEASSLRVKLAHEGIDDLDPQYDYIAGTRERLSLDFTHGSAQGRLALGYAYESNDRDGPGVSPYRNEAYAGYEFYLPQDWSIEAEGFLRASRYSQLAVPRDEDLAELRLTGRRELSSGWLLEGEWRIGSNDSNDERYSYDRTRLDLGISKVF